MAQLLDSSLETFRADFTGETIAPGDPGYDSARAIWNGGIDKRPSLFARCATAEQVAEAIRFARQQDLEISVRGGAHNFAGSALTDGGLTIDLTAMRQVRVDPATRRVIAGGGATWGDVDGAAQEHGLAFTGGFISHTGIGGLTLGGGVGWLTRKAGLSIDNLVGVEIVTADSRVLHASATENPDLFWAVRGGGGNFGVVTSFEYAAHQVGPMVNLGVFFWGLDQGREALQLARDYVATAPDDTGTFIAALNAPPAPFVPEQYHFAPCYLLAVAGFGTPEEHAAAVAPIRERLSPLIEMVTPIPYAALQAMFDESAPWGILGYEKALYLEELSDAAIEVIVEHVPRKQSPMSFVPIFAVGGAYSRVGDADTAFGGSRNARFFFNIAAVAPTPDLLEADRTWVRNLWEALRPFAADSGSYVNFMSEYEDDRVRAAYGPDKYDRLARIKAEYDPENVFHLNANIKPSR